MTTDVATRLTDNALTILDKRYFHVDDDGRKETQEEFFERISLGNPQYLKMLTDLDFLPNSPTLFNVGVPGAGTLSACFKFNVHDTMTEGSYNGSGILDVGVKAAMAMKFGGGIGYKLEVRAKGELIHSTHGKAMGPVAILSYYHEIAKMITQGGKREGAQIAILDCDHPDIEEFIHAKDIGGTHLDTFNISVALTDKFMDIAVNESSSKQARLLREMAESAWRTGDPGCFFIDRAERANPTPWLGKLDGTNPCGEVPLLDNEACNLGSINLWRFVDLNTSREFPHREFDWSRLEETVRLSTRYLDDVLDLNIFPIQAITDIVQKTRKLGLGVAGLADTFDLKRIQYDSEEAVLLSSEMSRKINGWALNESQALATEKGIAPAYEEDPNIDDRIATGSISIYPRNTTRTCIAPTGTISILMDASSGIEPHFDLEWDRTLGDGEILTERIAVWDYLDGFIPHVSKDISSEYHIAHQAAWQKNTDLAVSKTINMPESATVEDIHNSYIDMWKSDLVGGTIYRDKSRDVQVLSSGEDSAAVPVPSSGRAKLPNVVDSKRRKFRIGEGGGYMTVGHYPDGTPGELFLNISRRGSTEDSLYNSWAMLVSLYLQSGGELDKLVHMFGGRTFEPSGLTSDDEIKTATSVLDYVVRRLYKDYDESDQPLIIENLGVMCPSCTTGKVVMSEGCMRCTNGTCGWSRC